MPDGGSVDAETTNGPISITGVTGKFTLRAANGPIAVDDVSGQVTARASNGPISVSGSRGDIDAVTMNGPIAILLKGATGKASSKRGRTAVRCRSPCRPITAPGWRYPPEAARRGTVAPPPVAAPATGTGNSRTLRVGPDPVIVRVSTVNGPVSVHDSKR